MFLAGETVGFVGVRIGGRLHARVLVSVDALAEVDRVLKLLTEDTLAGVARHLEQEEAGVALREEVIGWIVLVHDLLKCD